MQFPTGVGGKGNSGVTSAVTSTPGAIGYISASYMIAAGLGAAAIQNKAGNFEYPNLKNIESAAAVVKNVPPNNELNISNPPKKASTAYPISTFTYAIVPHNAPQKGFAAAVRQVRDDEGSGIRSRARLRSAAEGCPLGREEVDRLPLAQSAQRREAPQANRPALALREPVPAFSWRTQASGRTTQRKPMCPVEVSALTPWRAAGR